MKLKSIFDKDNDDIITFEYEDGETLPEEGDDFFFPNQKNQGFKFDILIKNPIVLENNYELLTLFKENFDFKLVCRNIYIRDNYAIEKR